MSDDEPWWAPIRKAIVNKVADIIQKMPVQDLEQVLEADFEDLPAKAPPKRRKALPARPRARDDWATGETQERQDDAKNEGEARSKTEP